MRCISVDLGGDFGKW
uniref:Uncharacterized protein n=1 Tax=Arundo donax TaxID=35708 RepID=A0A0A8XTU4_ARUDO